MVSATTIQDVIAAEADWSDQIPGRFAGLAARIGPDDGDRLVQAMAELALSEARRRAEEVLGRELDRLAHEFEPELGPMTISVSREVGSSQLAARDRDDSHKLRHALLNELHDFLCGGEEYEQQRESAIKEYGAGKTAFVASVTAALTPVVGGGAQFVAAAIAVTLTVASQIGLGAWCRLQAARRSSS